MSCANIMTPNPKAVREDDTIGAAAREIIDHTYINLPVVDAEGRLVGLFGVYDLLALLVPRVAVIGNLLPNLRFLGDDDTELQRKFDARSHSDPLGIVFASQINLRASVGQSRGAR